MSVLRLRNTNTPGKGAQVMYTFVSVYIYARIYTHIQVHTKCSLMKIKCSGMN